MKHLWEVEFEIKYSGIGDWIGDEKFRVISNGDGLKAISKARPLALKRQFQDGDGSVRRALDCRVVGLEQLHEIDA